MLLVNDFPYNRMIDFKSLGTFFKPLASTAFFFRILKSTIELGTMTPHMSIVKNTTPFISEV